MTESDFATSQHDPMAKSHFSHDIAELEQQALAERAEMLQNKQLSDEGKAVNGESAVQTVRIVNEDFNVNEKKAAQQDDGETSDEENQDRKKQIKTDNQVYSLGLLAWHYEKFGFYKTWMRFWHQVWKKETWFFVFNQIGYAAGSFFTIYCIVPKLDLQEYLKIDFSKKL